MQERTSSPAEQSLRDGNVADALRLLQEQVRKDPAAPKHRVFLFQLLTVCGAWDRAKTQLSVLKDMDASTIPMVQAYGEALRCEVLRTQIFAGRRTPLLFGEPERWMALLAEALRVAVSGEEAKARDLRAEAFELAPATGGSLEAQGTDGQAATARRFEWIADADTRLGPMLEAIVNGRYYWIPFHRIRRIDVEAPADLRDVVWMPAHFAWENGGEAVGLIPTRYPGSEASPDGLLQLARRTEWRQPEEGVCVGLGQRMLATDGDDYPLMSLRAVRLGPDADGGAADAGGNG